MKATGRGLLVDVDRWGTVYVRCLGDAPQAEDRFVGAPVSPRLALALAPEPYPRRTPGPLSIVSGPAARSPGLRREPGYVCALPLPDT